MIMPDKLTDTEVIPISLKQANEYVTAYHRHHKAVRGCKFCIGLKCKNDIVGVAICGRPVSRHYDDGKTLEINRLCTNGYKNACSECPIDKVEGEWCETTLVRYALDLINRQEDKCKAYKHYYDECLKDLKNANAEIKKLQDEYRWLDQESDVLVADVENLNRMCDEVNAENESLKEKNSNLTSDLSSLQKDLTSAKAEVERLKAEVKYSDYLEYETTNQIKAEAYKECIEKVTDKAELIRVNAFEGKWAISQDELDNLLNELVGDNK